MRRRLFTAGLRTTFSAAPAFTQDEVIRGAGAEPQ
jgi:hypothetical protein